MAFPPIERRDFLKLAAGALGGAALACGIMPKLETPTAIPSSTPESNIGIDTLLDTPFADILKTKINDRPAATEYIVDTTWQRIQNMTLGGVTKEEREEVFWNHLITFQPDTNGPFLDHNPDENKDYNYRFMVDPKWGEQWPKGQVTVWKNGLEQATGKDAIVWFLATTYRDILGGGFMQASQFFTDVESDELITTGFSVFANRVRENLSIREEYRMVNMAAVEAMAEWVRQGYFAGQMPTPDAGKGIAKVFSNLIAQRGIAVDVIYTIFQESRLDELMVFLVDFSDCQSQEDIAKKATNAFIFLNEMLEGVEANKLKVEEAITRFNQAFYPPSGPVGYYSDRRKTSAALTSSIYYKAHPDTIKALFAIPQVLRDKAFV